MEITSESANKSQEEAQWAHYKAMEKFYTPCWMLFP